MDIDEGATETGEDARRRALRALSRSQLQARAKKLGVRANRKSVDIVEAIVEAISAMKGAPPSANGSQPDAVKEEADGAAPAPLQPPLAVTAEALEALTPVLAAGNSSSSSGGAAAKENQRPAADDAATPAWVPRAAAGTALLTPPTATAQHLGAPGSVAGAATGRARMLSDLATQASALALAAKLNNLRLASELKASGLTPSWRALANQDDEPTAASGPRPEPAAAAPASSDTPCEELAVPPRAPQPCSGDEPVPRRLAFAGSSPALCSEGAGETGTAAGATTRGLGAAAQPLGPVLYSTPCAAAHSPSTSSSTSPPAAVQEAQAPQPSAIKTYALHVTDRTPARQQRLAAPPGHMLTPWGGGAAGANPLLARTPAGGALRTPARRVAVCPDEAQARALDTWVHEHLASQPAYEGKKGTADPGNGLRCLERLGWGAAPSVVSGASSPPAAAPEAPSRGTRSTPARPAAAAAAAAKRVGSGASCAAAPAARAKGGSPSAAPGGGAESAAAAPGTGVAVGAARTTAAVLLCGTACHDGALAHAVAAAAGATLLRVPPNLPSALAGHEHAGKADAVLRAVFRVATSRPGPVVLHFPAVDQLVEAAQDAERKRMRTELMVGVEELMLGAQAATGARRPVLVLSSCAAHGALDQPLGACLGRTARVLAGLPDEEEREALLVGVLAEAGAALRVQDVERLVRESAGLACADIKAACVEAAAAVRHGGGAALTLDGVLAAVQARKRSV